MLRVEGEGIRINEQLAYQASRATMQRRIRSVRFGWRLRKYKDMNEAARYVKIVEWSEEDHCFVGSCPGLFYGGCHGENEQEVFADLCRRVEEIIELFAAEGRDLPPVTSGRDFANRMQQV